MAEMLTVYTYLPIFVILVFILSLRRVNRDIFSSLFHKTYVVNPHYNSLAEMILTWVHNMFSLRKKK